MRQEIEVGLRGNERRKRKKEEKIKEKEEGSGQGRKWNRDETIYWILNSIKSIHSFTWKEAQENW